MTAKDFLLSNDPLINKAAVAFAMYPDNKSAPTHLNKKLNGLRTWNADDESKAVEVLTSLGKRIEALEKG